MAFEPFYNSPRTLQSFEQLCDLLDQEEMRTERSSESGIVLVIDSEGNKERYFKEFNITREDRDELNNRIREFLIRGEHQDGMSVLDRQSYRQEADDLFKIISAYAHCLPEVAKDSFDAYCDGCLKPARVEVGEKEVIVHCKDCNKKIFE